MSAHEPLPIGTLSPEQIEQAKAGAAVLDLAAIEARVAGPTPGQGDYDSVCENLEQAEADRVVLLTALREAWAEVERLREELAEQCKECEGFKQSFYAVADETILLKRRMADLAATMRRLIAWGDAAERARAIGG